MIFHVTAAHGLVNFCRAFKFTKNLLIGLSHNIGKHIQSAAMGHAYYYFMHFMISSGIYNGIKRSNCGLTTFQ